MAATTQALTAELPVGVFLRDLQMHPDDRGSFTEIFRQEWETGMVPVQWNLVSSIAGVLRGVHVHARHVDYLVVVQGRAAIGLRDLRRESATFGRAAIVELDGEHHRALTIPPGVAHGFYFRETSILVYSVSHYWDQNDEIACRWDDPELGLRWRISEPPDLSPRDSAAGSLREMIDAYERLRQQIGNVENPEWPDESAAEIRLP